MERALALGRGTQYHFQSCQLKPRTQTATRTATIRNLTISPRIELATVCNPKWLRLGSGFVVDSCFAASSKSE
jgi:hypothetical protein